MTFLEWFYKVFIIQAVYILIMLSTVLILKYFYKEEFKNVQDFYQEYIISNTDVNEVLK